MKHILFFVAFMTAIACGSREDYLSNSATYQVRNDLALSGELVLSFQQVYLFRSISIDATQSSACETFSKDHETKTGQAVVPGTLKLTYDAPARRCARRNTFNQCETYQYIYTFHCRYKTAADSN
ncbi:hypothetical protein [Oligoflexus tunisiensis]|uniref:hypothetical protein n=1 Tax=Oligoflexus tunisiensis TaxID=708132 RepID=UPI00114CB23C|nr:hypothetical protein [Oligoflexus tunisiensis]